MAIASKFPFHNEQSYLKYHILSDQRDLLKQRLELQLPTTSAFSTMRLPEAPDSSHTSSPTLSRTSYSASLDNDLSALSPTTTTYSPTSSSTSSLPIPAHPSATSHTTPARGRRSSDSTHTDCAEAKALYALNQEIKATLTELLNTDSVRGDERFRAYVQSMLMSAERELRGERRRRSSVERWDLAERIGGRFEGGVGMRFTL